ncbi:nuclear transport factor 2 family protein [Mycobacterium sp. 663a-19]|uniref:nuclear transport factor 2 family protein n=1 Tax=Mycobacterium sp. 663a-19 TaxID=2986148 RepID=UPI002D1E8050|nr:nuclear transport factor 2 family protein [Mycobacterium sp. 663a-19]MEB3981583.1 nuclear transport factor 2 family protein [Mycobacterium sp. 663a-19]
MELGVLGPLQVRQDGTPVVIPGAKPRAILTMLGLHGGAVVSADALVELIWGNDPPRTADKALQTHISALRRALGDGFVLTQGSGWTANTTEIDASRYKAAAKKARDAAAAGDTSQAVAHFEEALTLWRGVPELPDTQRGTSEKTRWIEGHAALVEDRADALLAAGRATEIIGELEAAVAEAPLRERRWGQLMLALYRAGRQGDALSAYQRARSMLANELGVDPGPNLRRLEAAIVSQDASLDAPVAQQMSAVTRSVTFLLTDIEGSTAAWEADYKAMAVALARHDELVEQVVTARGGKLIKTRGEGDATFSVFERPSVAAAAAIELQDAITREPWALAEPLRIRIALHTGEVELRDGDYFGRAVNRAARLRSLATGGQILCSGVTAELAIDSLSDDVVLVDLGTRQLKNLARPEHVFELRSENGDAVPEVETVDMPLQRPALPSVFTGPGPFVGRGDELGRLLSAWNSALDGGVRAVLIAGEPGVGKTRLAGEWSRQAYEQGGVVLYGRCDEDLGAPYQPFAEALRALVPCLGTDRLRRLRGVEALLPLIPGLTDVVPDVAAPPHADPDTERYALFDAVVALLEVASASAPIVLILDDLHWAAKPTLLLLRHLLRFGENGRVQIVGTYRSTDLDRSHPLAAMLADLHRSADSGTRLQLSGLDEDAVTAYVAEAGYDDEELARALASVTGGNPFFLIEALRHVDESGGVWNPSTLPQGVREAVSRRLSRLPSATNKALAAAAVVGSRFSIELVERVVEEDLVDAFDEACKAGIIIEEPGGYYRFNHALIRQSLLTELPSVRRMRLHQRIAATLETQPGADDERLAELAHHYFECAWAGNAAKAVEYCRRAADQAMARLAYEGAADLYDRALHALEELDDELPDRDDQIVELLVARCEALLAAGDVASAAGAVSQLQEAAHDSARLAAWATCFDGELSMLTHPERLDEIEAAVGAAASKLAELDDAAGEAKAHTVRAQCLGRLGRVADCETALDDALTAARRAREHRRVNAVLASAPLAALWGPNPVPRAGGRCLDVVRLLRITTDSPAVEATSTRCQAVLEAFRGRAEAARRMIDSARRTVTELGLRHAMLEVEQFAGIVELVVDDPGAAEPHLRKAYNGFRRMGIDADTAETAALLGRVCLALGRDAEADELCAESERLAGHALAPSIAWRMLRAQLLARRNDHKEARRIAEAAVTLAERTDALVHHGDACLALATVLDAAGDTAGSRAAAERAADLYEQKGAAALAEKARQLLDEREPRPVPTPAASPTEELDNACVRVLRQMEAAFDREAWGEINDMFASNVSVESRRMIVGFAQEDVSPADWPRVARHLRERWAWQRNAVIAIRGERLALTRIELGTDDASPGAPREEMLQLHGIDTEGRVALQIFFDIDDMDSAIAELDASQARLEEEQPPEPQLENECARVIRRGEAAIDRQTWDEFEQLFAPEGFIESRRKITGGFTRDDYSSSEARRLAKNGALRIRNPVIAVRGERLALARLEISTADVSPGAPRDEMLALYALDEDGRIARQIIFDTDDMGPAMAELETTHARFEAEQPTVRRLANKASQAYELMRACFTSRDWDRIAQILADDIVSEDRRRTVNIGFRQGRDAAIADLRVNIDLGVRDLTATVIATRGDHLALMRLRAGHAQEPEAFHAEVLNIIETDADDRINASVTFDLEDIDVAFEELDARYLAGEAAAHAHTWSVVGRAYDAFNRREPPATTPDWVNIDRRRGAAFAPGDTIAYIQAAWEDSPDTKIYIAAVHQLSNIGAVVTHMMHGTAQEGFDAEWQDINLVTIEGDLINHCEIFDEADLDAALARFDELSQPAPRLENAASQVADRFLAQFAACDWDAIAELLTDDFSNDDRRRVVGASMQHGRDATIDDLRAIADLWSTTVSSTVIATRGERLALMRFGFSDSQGSEAFISDIFGVAQITADERVAAFVAFDADDFDAAVAELDARYVAGEAAAYAETWSVITRAYGAVNRLEPPPITQDWVNIDHRGETAFGPDELIAYLRADREADQVTHTYVESVHRLNNRGAVITYAANETSREGFDAEWRGVAVLIVEGEMVNRTEVFDETNLEVALARFNELNRPAAQLESAASELIDRFVAYFSARDWDALAQLFAEDYYHDDRRRVVNAGLREGRDAAIEDLRLAADVGFSTNVTLRVIATRGDHLVLTRSSTSGRETEAIQVEALQVIEHADGRVTSAIWFDPEDLDAAFAELDARYLAGEAAAHSHSWTMVTNGIAAINRHEVPPITPDCLNVDHRRGRSMAPGDLVPYARAAWDLTPDLSVYVEAVHRLKNFGAVVTVAVHGTSQEGFDAEWREIHLLMFDGDMASRGEFFDEEDLDAAIERFEQLRLRARQLESAASELVDRIAAYYAARDWDALKDLFAEDYYCDDRRRVVNAGVRQGQEAAIEDLRVVADLGLSTNVAVTIIATRGHHLVLTRWYASGRETDAVQADVLQVVEYADERITSAVLFDPEDLDAAFAELDARYLAGEAAPHAHTWSVIEGAFAAVNKHEFPKFTPDWVNVDHRRAIAFAPGEGAAFLHATLGDGPDIRVYAEAVHRLSDLGTVVTMAAHSTSQQGFVAEWRVIDMLTVDGDAINRGELFDAADLDTALEKFDELDRRAPRLKNAASQATDRFLERFAARDWDAMAELIADDISSDDRRRGITADLQIGRDLFIRNYRAAADLGVTQTSNVIATRGDCLVLNRARFRRSDGEPEEFGLDLIHVIATNADNRLAAAVTFDIEDIDAAFEELEARYLVGEAAAYSQTWSAVAGGYAAVNRRELPPTTADLVNIDHRRGASAFAPGDLVEYVHAIWDDSPNSRAYIESVQRLTDVGAVFTHVGTGTSQDGFDAEWRLIAVGTVDGNLINRCEFFDEADLDAALARFDELTSQKRRLENAASRADEKFWRDFAARNWDAIAEIVADEVRANDRRRVVNAGLRQGRDALIAELSALAGVGITNVISDVIATRGGRVVLSRVRLSDRRDQESERFLAEVLAVVEIDAGGRIVGRVVFDIDDIDAAFEELDARYLAGEAAAHAHAWLLVAGVYVALNRQEIPATTADHVSIDHRRVTTFPSGDIKAYTGAAFTQIPNLSFRIEAVHQLSDLGAVVTHAWRGTSQEGFEAEGSEIHLMTIEGNLFNRSEIFDEADLDAALAKFDELDRRAPRLENAASRAYERFWRCFARRDWAGMAETCVEDIVSEDRRRVVTAGTRQGRNVIVADMKVVAEVGTADNVTSIAVATRGDRLTLNRVHSPALQTELLNMVEVDADGRITTVVVFDSDDIDAAFEELDARYLAGEAAAHAHMWSLVTAGYEALNRHDQLVTAPDDYVIVDHRLRTTIDVADLTAYLRASWDLTPDLRMYIEAVHRLSDSVAVVTHTAYGKSREGLDVEWRMINLVASDGDLINRCELFNEADLDAALATFEELQTLASRLGNIASQVNDRFDACFASRDWDAMAQMLADEVCIDDRRRVVNAGTRHGRDAEIAVMRAIADVGTENIKSVVVATRGQRLALLRTRFTGSDRRPEAFHLHMLDIIEIDSEQRILARIAFDLDNIDGAFAELNARYLAGEAAAHAHTWSVIVRAYSSLNRRELPATTPDWTSIDHRRFATLEDGAFTANIRAWWDLTSEARIDVEAVHRLSHLGAVISQAPYMTWQEGAQAESREVCMLMVDGDRISRCELFDEADLDAALARFDELQTQTPRLENPASQVDQQFWGCIATSDWDATAELIANDIYIEDRRKTVNAGIRHGRNAYIADLRTIAEFSQDTTSAVVATRGSRLALTRIRTSNRNLEFAAELLCVVEIDADDRMVARIGFDLDDIDAAFEELESRYLAGEAAAHARIWSLLAQTYTAFNRHVVSATTPDWISIDHRRGIGFAPGDMISYIHAAWDVAPDAKVFIETAPRLSALGAVVIIAGYGTSQEGFDAEWREIHLMTFDGDLINRCEVFDDTDIEAALARFDELQPQVPRLENANVRVGERLAAGFLARDWEAMAESLVDDFMFDDRRRTVNVGIRRGGDAYMEDLRAVAALGFTNMTWEVIATRGERLSLSRGRYSGRDDAFEVEVLHILETDANSRCAAVVVFDLDDIDAAFEELDARYLAGEAAPHSHTWRVIADACTAFNRREMFPTTPDWVSIDHRPAVGFAPGDMSAYIGATWDVAPDVKNRLEVVHRLSDLGAVVTHATKGTSNDGVVAEWREIGLLTVEGDLIDRIETFDEADLAAALARFDELDRPAPHLENAATRARARVVDALNRRDVDGLLALATADGGYDDRRRILRDEGIARPEFVRALFEATRGMKLESEPVAVRGSRLALTRDTYRDIEDASLPVTAEHLTLTEISGDDLVRSTVIFDPDDIDAAFEELETRYVAGEAAAHG